MTTEKTLWETYEDARSAMVATAEVLAEHCDSTKEILEWTARLRPLVAAKRAAWDAWWANVKAADEKRARIIHEIDSRPHDARAIAALIADGGPAHEQEAA